MEEFFVEGVKIKELLIMVGGVRFYGFLRWKFRLFQPGLGIAKSVKMTVKFSVFTSNATWTYECMRVSGGTLSHANSSMTVLYLCILLDTYSGAAIGFRCWGIYHHKGCIRLEFSGELRSIRFSLMMFPDPTVLMLLISLLWVFLRRFLAANGVTELAYLQVSLSVWISTAIVVKLQEACYNIDAISRWMCGMLSNSGVVVIAEHNRRSAHSMVFGIVTKSAYHASSCTDNRVTCFFFGKWQKKVKFKDP
ncbi:uncharacterized protein LOC113346429 isoform X1 [Papaver somniferum]|uniref:uncharacterized protein LOC113346429 isoform X1 n=1 Tax=Papaver somniferum TaxID=3469 RepID=UPI000E6F5DF3|nr:uncharacterized protein LOC113346429 isoform X1 [Papaver somniferum]